MRETAAYVCAVLAIAGYFTATMSTLLFNAQYAALGFGAAMFFTGLLIALEPYHPRRW